MKRFAAVVCAVLLFLCAFPCTSFAEPSDIDKNGIINYNDYGELIVLIQMRLRDLGYFLFKPTGKFQSVTVNATMEFQKYQTDQSGQSIIIDGTIGPQSQEILFSSRAVRAPIPAAIDIPSGPRRSGTPTANGVLRTWSVVKEKLVEGQTYTLTDFNTGETFSMQFCGGENHAEMECASSTDTATYKELYGEAFTYFKRPMLIELDGELIACSLQGQPHGTDTVSGNDMQGHACLFFDESLSHVGALADVEHINQIYIAAGRN